jgi:hypothetical protein
VVTLEGSTTRYSTVDFVYWLQQHLRQAFGLDLDHWPWDLSTQEQDRKLWTWKKMAMSELFKSRTQQAGFPRGMLSFHSLRSGFLCSAFLKTGTDRNLQQAILEHTAFVGGWAPAGRAQLRYMKTTAKKTIVASRLTVNDDQGNPCHHFSLSLEVRII